MKRYVLKLAGREDYLTGRTLKSRAVINPAKAMLFTIDVLPEEISGLRYKYVLDRSKMAYLTPNGVKGIEVVDFWEAQKAYEKRVEIRNMVRRASKGKS